MKVTLCFELFGELTAVAGRDHVTLTPPAPPETVGDALALLARDHPALAAWIDRCAVASGADLLLRRDLMPRNARLALLPPVTGG